MLGTYIFIVAKIALWIVAAILALLACFVLVAVFVSDAKNTITYLCSDRTSAQVLHYIGEEKTENWGRRQLPTTYYKFCVCYYVNGRNYTGEYLTKSRAVRVGGVVWVHYTIRDDGSAEILNSNIANRFARLCTAIVFTVLVVIFMAVTGAFK